MDDSPEYLKVENHKGWEVGKGEVLGISFRELDVSGERLAQFDAVREP